MIKKSQPNEFRSELFNDLKTYYEHYGPEESQKLAKEWMELWILASTIYEPSEELKARIEDYIKWCEVIEKVPAKERPSVTSEDAGQLLEEIVCLAFDSINGRKTLKSYQSYAHQVDLLVTSTGFEWQQLFNYLKIDTLAKTIVIEVKNTDGPVEDKQFGRFCGLLEQVFAQTAVLGVIVARNGASGFPKPGRRKRCVSDSQMTQLLFHARTNKFVVVLDDSDIRRLSEPGMLPKILESKIRAIESWTGLPTDLNLEGHELDDLPPHLAKYNFGER